MLVSAIMPTRGRQQYAQEALGCFLSQTYQDRELVIVDDADDPSFPEGVVGNRLAKRTTPDFREFDRDPNGLLPEIRYFRLDRRLTIGAKRNLACSRASGGVIVHWDDDDWSAPERIEDQVTRLIDSNVGLTGYNRMRFYDVDSGEWWMFNGGKHQVIGTSMMYTREFWRSLPFPDINEGEDHSVSNKASKVAVVDAGLMMFARTHAGNTSKRTGIGKDSEWVNIA